MSLLSYGLATDPHWAEATQEAVEQGIPVHVVELARTGTEPTIVALELPEEIRVGHTARALFDQQRERLAKQMRPFLATAIQES